jgi:deoxyribodipyrimidine photo-lyase
MLDALDTLRSWYRERGSDLLIAHGDPADVLPELAEEYGAETVTWGKDYSGLARERDAEVRRALNEHDITRNALQNAVLHEPGDITTNDGDPYSVFTYFGRKWHDRAKTPPFDPPAPEALADVTDDTPLPTRSDLGFDDPDADVPTGGMDAAQTLLDRFLDGDVYRYEDRRDYPVDECHSRLSPHLKFGTIGIRTVYQRTETARDDTEPESDREASVKEFQSQLAWREFYTQVLFANPTVVTDNYKDYEHEIDWADDPEGLQAWKDGETGYPIVDAGMRQLRTEAFMHNRVRMIVASFLTKDLLIDWREGYEWFREKLVDHDTANDNGGWQWAASTGTDAQPYFRIFNPMTQGERYDPDAEYITQYIPELDGVDPEIIHSWHECSLTQRRNAAPDYPDPIVDHSERREQAIEMFERARGDE